MISAAAAQHAGDDAEERLERHRAEEAGRPARELVAERVRQEPDAHHQADDAHGRELGDGAEADRAQAQLAELRDEVGRRRATTG